MEALIICDSRIIQRFSRRKTLKNFFIKVLNKLYLLTLDKPSHRKRYNDFLFFFLWKLRFTLSSLLPIDEKLIVFVANHDKEIPAEYLSLYQKAKANGFKCVVIFDFDKTSRVVFKRELNKFKSDLKFQKYYARAKAVFLYDYYLPAYANEPRKNTRLVQLWHACGAFKRWGYSVKDSSWGFGADELEKYRVHKNYTDIITSAKAVNEKYAEAFCVDISRVHALGVPRTDVYFDEKYIAAQRDTLEKKYPFLKGKRLILWAPTLRGNSISSSYAEKSLDFFKLKEAFGDEYVLLVKLHPHVAKKLSFTEQEKEQLDGFAVDISSDIQISTALCCADTVITDYSSLIFEFAVFEKPMVFYAYDLEKYKGERSFYYDYEDFVPGEIAENTDELIAALRNAQTGCDKEKLHAFREKFMSACDGKATERIYEKYIR